MATTGDEHVTAAAAGEETPLRKAAETTELSAPDGWTKKVGPRDFPACFHPPLPTCLDRNFRGRLSSSSWVSGSI
jgi:hypothetical protein